MEAVIARNEAADVADEARADTISEDARNEFLKFLDEIKKETTNCSAIDHTNHSNHNNW